MLISNLKKLNLIPQSFRARRQSEMSDLVNLNLVVKNHLDGFLENRLLDALTVKKSSIEGRGIFAVRDLDIGELIFVDYPLIMGARTTVKAPAGCIHCYRTDKILKPCTKGCGLPVCSSDCENSPTHILECKLITSWKTTDLTETLNCQSFAKCLAPLRALLLSESSKEFLLSLAIHNSPRHGAELRYIKKFFQVSKAEEFLMNRACCALDANAYEMLLTTTAETNADLRGLFPVAALMNHSCVPNIRTDFDALGRMYVRASVFIPAESEICTSYTNLLWATPARRNHLMNTKHFLCQCIRCSDRTEFGTFLTALKCLNRSCNGVQLPVSPLDFSSHWRCGVCDAEVTPRQIGGVQSALAGYIGSLNLENPSVVFDLIRNKVNKFLPESNHIVFEMKCLVINAVGVAEGHLWKGKDLKSKPLISCIFNIAIFKRIFYKIKKNRYSFMILMLY